MNIFLDDVPDADLRGWFYQDGCDCMNCKDFYEAAYALVSSYETGEPIEKFYDAASAK